MVRTMTPHPPTWCRRLAAALALLLGLVAPAWGQDWPQWRGADGMAVSEASGLPAVLDEASPELAWKVPVPGQGISSPIVSEGRVFVTTAYPGDGMLRFSIIRAAIPVLGLVAAVLVGWSLLRRRAPAGEPPPAALRWLLGLDRLAIVAISLGFAVLAGVAAYRPELFWPAGQPGHTWFFTGAFALAGGAAAAGWFAAASPLRLVVALALGGAAAYLFQNIPDNQYSDPFKLEYRVVMTAPAWAGGFWHLLVFLVARGRERLHGLRAAPLGALCLLGSGGLLFGLFNLWLPNAGLARAVVCYDLASGDELWNTALFTAPEERKYPTNSYATPTPCADGEIVFAHFGSGYACLDYDGNVLWQAVDDEFPEKTRYGAAASPVLFEDTILVLRDRETEEYPSYLQALDKATGEIRWRVEPKDAYHCYMTPLVMRRGAEPELVTVTADKVVSYDPRSGDRLWKLDLPVKQMVPSIQHAGDRLVISGGSHLEYLTTAIDLTGHGQATRGEMRWKTNKTVPDVVSPVLADGTLVCIKETFAIAWDVETGDRLWRERLEDTHWASLVSGDGKIYAVSESGKTTVIATGREYQVLGEGQLEGTCFATPAIADGRVLVRTDGFLYCFGSGS